MSIVVLHCVAGDHDWERQSQRGRKPFNCPEHAAEIAAAQSAGAGTRASSTTFTKIEGVALTDRLESLLKSRGTHIAQVGWEH